ncbi:hypothetical protein TNCT6_44940 [Streptomyces sp. 6-11-2]|nr:hypothetical protein TNCT6_44940 [Streptomyces sp. 6-11-2]
MVVPFGSALERRSRTTYRPTVTPEGSTHVDTFTGTTSLFSRTASGKVAVAAVVRQRVFAEVPWPDATESEHRTEVLGASSRLPEVRPCDGGARCGRCRFS